MVLDEVVPFSSASDNYRFSASMASFGMLLQKSKYTGEYSYESVITLAKSAKGMDDDGSRPEFIQLVEMVAVL